MKVELMAEMLRRFVEEVEGTPRILLKVADKLEAQEKKIDQLMADLMASVTGKLGGTFTPAEAFKLIEYYKGEKCVMCVMCGREYKAIFPVTNVTPSMCPECSKKYDQEKRILDSGERTTFSTGAVRDMHEGKGRMDLLPWAAIIEVSKHCENGAKKYGEHNVDRGIPTHSLLDSAMRHAAKYLDGQDEEDHLLAAAWNLLWAVEMRCKNPECVDTPWSKERKGGTDT